jgi:hypothetical protein
MMSGLIPGSNRKRHRQNQQHHNLKTWNSCFEEWHLSIRLFFFSSSSSSSSQDFVQEQEDEEEEAAEAAEAMAVTSNLTSVTRRKIPSENTYLK